MYSLTRTSFSIVKLGRVVFKNNYMDCNLFHILHLREDSNLIKQCCKRFSTSATNIESEEKEIDIEYITNGDKEVAHKLKVILLEAEVMRQEGKLVPEKSFFTVDHWKELLDLPTRSARRKYFEYLFKLSKKKEHRKEKKLERRLKKEECDIPKEAESLEEFALKYDLAHNNIFLRFYDTTINQMYNNRLIQAMMFGHKLVVDCGYDENMTRRENLNCAKQLMLLFAENRLHDDPFDLHYCNVNPDGVLLKQLQKFIPSLCEPSFPLNVHQGSYLDLFPRDQLVYLTPHCRQELTEFDHNDIYIIGAIVDKVNNEPLSLAKAKKEGLRMAKLPLDKYLQWGAGSGKSLTLNQVTSILNDIKFKGSWEFALRHVPKRKIVEYSFDNNISETSEKQQYSKDKTKKRWIPSSNKDLKNIVYNKNNAEKQ